MSDMTEATQVAASPTLEREDLAAHRKAVQAAHRKAVRDAVTHMYPRFFTTSSGRIDKRSMLRIFDRALEDTDFSGAVVRQRLLKRIIKEAVRGRAWRCCQVPEIIRLRIPRSQFTAESSRDRKVVHEIVAALLRSLEQVAHLSLKEREARIAVSAIFFSGLIEKDRLLRWLSLGKDGVTNLGREDLLYCPIPANKKKASEGLVQGMFVDDVTRLLLLRHWKDGHTCLTSLWLPEKGYADAKVVMTEIRQLLVKFGADKRLIPKTLSTLCRIGKARLQAEVPAYLWWTASGRTSTYSFPPAVVERLFTGLTVEERAPTEFEVPVTHDEEESKASYRPRVVRPDRTTEGDESSYADIETLIDAWASDLRNGRVPGHGRHSATTVHDYKRTLTRVMIPLAVGIDFTDLSDQEIGVLYESVLDLDATTEQIVSASKCLLLFHKFLVFRYAVPPVDFSEIEGYLAPRHSVKARLVAPAEYRETLDELWPGRDPMDRIGRIRVLATILAYRLGMRAAEVLRLRVMDLRGVKFVELCIRNTEHGSVKSLSGKRWLPLEDLLSEHELQSIVGWRTIRKGEGASPSDLLFATSEAPNVLLKPYVVSGAVAKVLKRITGDPHVSLHILRHSFATTLLLCLEGQRAPFILDDRFALFRDIKSMANEGGTMNLDGGSSLEADGYPTENPYASVVDGRFSPRKILYQIALLTGHASPSMTLLHYLHCTDWILYSYLQQGLPPLNLSQLCALLPRGKSTIYARCGRGPVWDLPECVKALSARA